MYKQSKIGLTILSSTVALSLLTSFSLAAPPLPAAESTLLNIKLLAPFSAVLKQYGQPDEIQLGEPGVPTQGQPTGQVASGGARGGMGGGMPGSMGGGMPGSMGGGGMPASMRGGGMPGSMGGGGMPASMRGGVDLVYQDLAKVEMAAMTWPLVAVAE